MSLTRERQTSDHPAGSGLRAQATVLPFARPASPEASPAAIRLDGDSYGAWPGSSDRRV